MKSHRRQAPLECKMFKGKDPDELSERITLWSKQHGQIQLTKVAQAISPKNSESPIMVTTIFFKKIG